MANPEHLIKLKEGVEAWNEWREENPLLQPDLQGANLNFSQLQGAHLDSAQLQGAYLNGAELQGAHLESAQLQGALLWRAQLQGASLLGTQLQGVDLKGAFFDNATSLNHVILGDEKYGFASLADINWGGVNLAVVDWSRLKLLGDEYWARRPTDMFGMKSDKARRLELNRMAVRANRQLAVALQAQGLNEDAARFAYRANVLQRKVLWYQLFVGPKRVSEKKGLYALVWKWLVDVGESVRKFGSYVFSLFLGILAGYGYRPGRTLGWYLLIVLSYAGVYFNLEHLKKLHLSFIGALIFSITAFHGRGFFPGGFGYDDPVTILAAMEAVVGLLIELSFIATFTQRFFGK